MIIDVKLHLRKRKNPFKRAMDEMAAWSYEMIGSVTVDGDKTILRIFSAEGFAYKHYARQSAKLAAKQFGVNIILETSTKEH